MKIAVLIVLFLSSNLYAAINIERTKIVFNEETKSVGVGIVNKDSENPYLVQTWIEDSSFKKITLDAPLIAIPPVIRMEGGEKTIVRIMSSSLISTLPDDRETLYYLNVREIPKLKKNTNLVQVAVQTTIKLIYRPAKIKQAHMESIGNELKVTKDGSDFIVKNPTPYYISIVGFSSQKNDKVQSGFESITVMPFSSGIVKSNNTSMGNVWLTIVNDSGGRLQLCKSVS